MKVLVLTVSDRAARGEYEDKSGPAIKNIIADKLPDSSITCRIISDDIAGLRNALANIDNFDIVITTGGTGIGPRDRTPDITEEVCDYTIPGIGEFLRNESLKQTLHAVLSRQTAGIRNKTLIVNFPGSVSGASFCAELMIPVFTHAVKMIQGKGH